MGKINKVIISGVIIGLILSLSQPLYNLGILVFPGFALFFLALKITKKASHAFWLGYFAGLVYFLISFKWHWAVYPLKNLGIESPYLGFFLVFFVWVVTAGSLALTWGVSAGLCKKLDLPVGRQANQISWSTLLIFPSVFTILEYLRSFLIGLVWVGRQTPIGPNWTIGGLAYNLHESFLALKLASWFGIYGVTFLIIFVGLLLFIFLEKRKYKNLLVLILFILALLYFPTSYPHTRSDLVSVAVIQTKIPSQTSYTPNEETSIFKNQLELIDSVSKNFPETKLVVFPENSNFFKTVTLFRNTAGASQYFFDLFDHPVLIVDNSKIVTDSQFQSKTIFLDSKKGIIGSYDKRLLTPGGEYIPLIFRVIDRILELNSPAIMEAPEYETGPKPPEAIFFSDKLSAGSLICSDIFSPYLAQKGAAHSKMIISQSSFAFAKGAPDLLQQDLAAAKFRAAENSRYLIKASNFGRSYIISDRGSLVKISSDLDWKILTGTVVLKDNKTLYNKVGDGPILLASLSVIMVSIFWRSPARRRLKELPKVRP